MPSHTWFYRVLPSFTEFYWGLRGFTGFYWVLLGFTGFYWVNKCYTNSLNEVERAGRGGRRPSPAALRQDEGAPADAAEREAGRAGGGRGGPADADDAVVGGVGGAAAARLRVEPRLVAVGVVVAGRTAPHRRPGRLHQRRRQTAAARSQKGRKKGPPETGPF